MKNIDNYNEIELKVEKQELEIINLKRELASYKNGDNSLESILELAKQESKDIKDSAREEAALIVDNAKKNANKIVNDALLRAEKIEFQREIMEKNMKIFKRKLKLIIDQQAEIVGEIDEIELE